MHIERERICKYDFYGKIGNEINRYMCGIMIFALQTAVFFLFPPKMNTPQPFLSPSSDDSGCESAGLYGSTFETPLSSRHV
ncbi:hypothetical protein ACTXT7_010352 [Hymenolepis weldensis]